MSQKLEALKKKLDSHLMQEAKLAVEILETVTDDEAKELREFLNNHPYAKVIREIRQKHKSKGKDK